MSLYRPEGKPADNRSRHSEIVNGTKHFEIVGGMVVFGANEVGRDGALEQHGVKPGEVHTTAEILAACRRVVLDDTIAKFSAPGANSDNQSFAGFSN